MGILVLANCPNRRFRGRYLGVVLRRGHTMIRKISVIPAAVAASAVIGISPAPASTGSQPVGSSTVGIGTGIADRCLSVQHDSDKPGTPIVVIHCHPNWPREQWLFTGGKLKPWGSSSVVTVSRAGFLVLGKPHAPFSTWTYGPGHELTISIKGSTAWVTWVPSNGRVPWVSPVPGPGQTVYIFTFLGG